MIGDHYWYTGVTLEAHECEDNIKWSITISFLDDGFCNQASSEGELRMRYLVDDLIIGIDTILMDAARLGLTFLSISPDDTPRLYMKGDGEWEGVYYPDGWETIIAEQSDRLGWRCIYQPRGGET